jgi:glucose-6-phosphate 1-dehydrogenase
MEPPARRGFGDVEAEKLKNLQAIRPVQPADLVRGQYQGYRDEAQVAADSDVETYCALRLFIDSWRWDGVPWSLRSGKCLPLTACEVLVRFEAPPLRLFEDAVAAGQQPNHLRFRFWPHSAIALAARVKRAGKGFVGDQQELVLVEEEAGEESAYERLLADAMAGNSTLFAREDAVEAAWKVVEPVLVEHPKAIAYPRASWGPAAADRLTENTGGWRNPQLAS